MGLFDQVFGGVMRSALGQAESQLLPGLLQQVLAQTNLGNIGGLLTQLQNGGLGNEVSSWLSNGSNMPVSADQLRAALGNQQLQQMAQAAGLPIDKLLAALSQHLPQAVDNMSPNGTLEEPAAAPSDSSLANQAGLCDIGSR